MKKYSLFLGLGILFGILLIKSEVASWFRIYEMFQFRSFHMYGVIGSAVVLGILVTQFLKTKKDIDGKPIVIKDKTSGWKSNLFGGIIFGLGWALGGACPAPMFALVGSGLLGVLLLIIGAIIGTYLYGALKAKLPH